MRVVLFMNEVLISLNFRSLFSSLGHLGNLNLGFSMSASTEPPAPSSSKGKRIRKRRDRKQKEVDRDMAKEENPAEGELNKGDLESEGSKRSLSFGKLLSLTFICSYFHPTSEGTIVSKGRIHCASFFPSNTIFR